MSELYRRKVEQLAESLRDPAIRPAALETIRGLIEAVTVNIDDAGEVTLPFADMVRTRTQHSKKPRVLRGAGC
ncbi:hypothetical protein [Roseinatronobacter alkalisoli]|uniref:hypothetical protein n=1 Tax=Roseinatronobacter alkalisoli TaxID=3028235 RepID=UPI00236866A7|nr:hypothetical protein [Roseinatronobacter sp. HJB301]